MSIDPKSLLKPVHESIGKENERVLDKTAFKAYAQEAYAKSLASKNASHEEKQKQVDSFNKLKSSVAGVAELQNIEADFEILNIFRDSIALDFAEMRPLPLGTLPIFRSKYINPVGLTVGSLAGIGSTNYYATKQYGQQVVPFTFKTEEGMIPNLNNLYDMQRLEERKNFLEREDEYMQIGLHNILVNTVYANPSSVNVITDDPAVSIVNYFAAGGSFAGKTVYQLDPGVITTSVPTVNVYDLSATEAGLTKKVFQTVNTHAIQIKRNFNRMYIPTGSTAGHSPVWESLQNMATPVALVVGQGNANPAAAVPHEMWSQFQQEDFRGDIIVNWFGLNLSIRKQNWLPSGYLVLFSEQPSVILWDRLELTGGNPQDGVLETPVDGFYSRRSRSKNIATARPDYCLRNFLTLKVNA